MRRNRERIMSAAGLMLAGVLAVTAVPFSAFAADQNQNTAKETTAAETESSGAAGTAKSEAAGSSAETK